MGKTDILHDLVAQIHDLGNAIDAQIDAQNPSGLCKGHTARYWHGKYLLKDRRCQRLAAMKGVDGDTERTRPQRH